VNIGLDGTIVESLAVRSQQNHNLQQEEEQCRMVFVKLTSRCDAAKNWVMRCSVLYYLEEK